MGIAGILSGRLSDRYGFRIFTFIGIGVLFLTGISLAFFNMNTPIWVIMPVLFVNGRSVRCGGGRLAIYQDSALPISVGPTHVCPARPIRRLALVGDYMPAVQTGAQSSTSRLRHDSVPGHDTSDSRPVQGASRYKF